MITALYAKYFQKSKTFLYPLLSIPKNTPYTPSGVYVSWQGICTPADQKLIVLYRHQETPGYHDFLMSYIYNNPLFKEERSTKDGQDIFVFDLANYSADHQHFLDGKYSQFSGKCKKIIRNYFGETSSEYKYIDTYLYPDRYIDLYAKLLNVEPALLESVGELCDKFNPVEEDLKILVEDLEVSKKAL